MKYVRGYGWLLALILLVAGFFYQTVFYRKLPVPSDTLVGLYHPWRDAFAGEFPRGVPFKNFLITDPVRQQIPWRKSVIDSWKAGTRPGWNPYSFTGVPLDANTQAAPFYPLNVLFFLFDFPVAWTLLIMLQPLLAGIFFYLYAKHRGISSPASFMGAATWAFSGFAISWLTWGTIMHTALWLPLILLALDMLSEIKKPDVYYARWAAVLAGAAVMAFFAGHIQVAIYVLLFSLSYGFWIRKQIKNQSVLRWIMISIGAVFIVTAVQWVPLLRFLSDSGRLSSVEAWKTEGWFLPWQHLVQFIAPDFFGNPATLNYWGIWNYGEFIGYLGIVPLILAVSAFGLFSGTAFFSVAGILSLLFMLPHPLSRLPFILHIPVLSVLQPTRLMVLVDFSLAMLAAYGLDRILKGDTKFLRRGMLCIGLGLAGLWTVAYGARFVSHDASLLSNFDIARRNLMLPTILFAGAVVWVVALRFMKRRIWRQWWVLALLCIVIFDLFRFGWKFTPFTPQAYFFPTTKIIDFLATQKKPFRVMALDDRILPPNVSGYYGIETIEGYDPIAPKRYEDFLVAGERNAADIRRPTGFNRIFTSHNIDSALLPYFNVRFVLSLSDIERPFLRLVMEEGETRLYEYTRAMPRVYLADTTIITRKSADILPVLFADTRPLLGVYDGKVPLLNISPSAEEAVDMINYSPNEIRLRVKSKSSRLLVILNRYDGRWSAVIDRKQQSRLFPVNYLFTGLVIPGGTHEVVLSYH